MPKKSIDYSKTIIYKIVCNDLNVTDLYVGHTTDFIRRKYQHKSSCNNKNSIGYNQKVYLCIRENGGWNNWSMIEIEKYPCKDLYEASRRERYWYELLNSSMNTLNPSRTDEEYRKDNREIIKLRNSAYYHSHKEEIIAKTKKWVQNNKERVNARRNVKFYCDCGGYSNYAHFSKHLKTIKHKRYLQILQFIDLFDVNTELAKWEKYITV